MTFKEFVCYIPDKSGSDLEHIVEILSYFYSR